MTKLTTFSPLDWQSFCGAERGANGTEPVIGSIVLDSNDERFTAILVADDHGVHLFTTTGITYLLALPNITVALAVAAAIPDVLDDDTFEAYGFECIG